MDVERPLPAPPVVFNWSIEPRGYGYMWVRGYTMVGESRKYFQSQLVTELIVKCSGLYAQSGNKVVCELDATWRQWNG
jgi:hypothetical protein